MTRYTAAIASLGLLAGSLLAVNPAPAPRSVDLQVAGLVRALGSPDYVEREAASKEIDRLGPAALPELRRAVAGTTDGEIFRRGQHLVARLEKRLADERILAPTMVEVNAVDKRIDEIVAELAKQSGYAVTFRSATTDHRILTFKTGNVPFWQAIEQLCDAANLQIKQVGDFTAPETKTTPLPTPGAAALPELPIPEMPIAGANAPVRNDPAAKVAELKKDIEKIAAARAEVAKEVNATAKVRAAALETIQTDAEAKLKAAKEQAEAAKRKAVVARIQPPAPPPVANAMPPAVGPQPRPGARFPGSNRGYAPSRHDTNAIVLELRHGAKRPSANFGAVRLETFALPANAAIPDTVAALVQVWAEPKLQWQLTQDIRVRLARDEHGQALAADPSAAVNAFASVDLNGMQVVQNGGVLIINNGGGQVVIRNNINGNVIINNGNVVISEGDDPTKPSTGTFTPNPRQAIVKLQPGPQASDVLKELSGILEAIVRTNPEPLITISDLTKPTEQMHPGARLKTSELTKGDEDSYTLDAELEYDPNTVQLAAPPGETNVENAMPQVPPFPGAHVIRRGPVQLNAGKVIFGLHITDGAGKPYMLRAQQKSVQHNGMTIAMKFSLTLIPTTKDQSAPAAIALWGIRSANVDIPFRLTDVPALAAK